MSKISLETFVSILLALTIIIACGDDSISDAMEVISEDSLKANYPIKASQLPEQTCSYSRDSSWVAYYTLPAERYGHGILGDRIEAGGLTLIHLTPSDTSVYNLKLSENYVFEDITPRLIDVDGDGIPEVVCIRSEVSNGAGLVIYKLKQSELIEYAWVPEIGTSNRWLNPVSIIDLYQNGTLDLLWIQTPHIGGVLKVASIKQGEMLINDSYSGVSNHAIGSRNQCLSAVLEKDGKLQIAVPNQSRNKVYYFSYDGSSLTKTSETEQAIDFDVPLYDQLEGMVFINDNNCLMEF
ncbi:MAG: VCBS repeat-containing protein [Cyclobacteriaceae bacterium]